MNEFEDSSTHGEESGDEEPDEDNRLDIVLLGIDTSSSSCLSSWSFLLLLMLLSSGATRLLLSHLHF